MHVPFWDERIERASRSDLEAIQLERLKKVVDSALKTPFYQKRLSKVGINSSEDITSLADLRKIPFTTKDDLRKSFPTGLLATEMEDVSRIHSSSGTTGIPTVIYFSQEDVDVWTDLVARCIVCTGASKNDVFQNMMTYGLFTGGLGLHYGAEKVGMTVIPVSSGNTLRQMQIMKDFQTAVVHATPSYMLHIRTVLEENGVSLDELNLKKAFIGAEPHSENVRKKIEELYNIDAYNSYGLSEMNGPGLAFECVHKSGMHFWEDGYIVEIVDPDTDENVEDGQPGEVIITNLIRHATPLMRYRTRDLASILPGQCECGRTHRRLSRIKGRTDDMLIINGVNVFPSQIEEVIMKIPEVGTNYQICLDKQGALDRLTVQVEIYSKMFTGSAGELESLRHRITEKLKGTITIKPVVKLHEPGFLPVYEGKAKRVIDNREVDED